MPPGSKVCSACRWLNGADERRCTRCGAPFSGPTSSAAARLLTHLLGERVPITRLYVGLCLLVYGLMLFDGAALSVMAGPPVSVALRAGALPDGLSLLEPWRLVSAGFVHFGLIHLAFNLMALVHFGQVLEPALGAARYAVVLVGSIVAGFVISEIWFIYFAPGPQLTAGISGGLFGLAGAIIGLQYAAKEPGWKAFATQFGLYAVLASLMLPVNVAAHAGGFVFGGALGVLFFRDRRGRHRSIWQIAGGLLVVGSIVSVVLSNFSDVWRVRRAYEMRVDSR